MCQYLGAAVVCAAVVCVSLVSIAPAEIAADGDVEPSDPATWTGGAGGTTGYIGKTSAGSVRVDGGSDLWSTYCYLGYSVDSTGAVTVDATGSTWSKTELLWVGYEGRGSLSLTNGGRVSNWTAFLAGRSGSTGTATVDGIGSGWDAGGWLVIGEEGQGTLNITNGGVVGTGQHGYLGRVSGAAGIVTIRGAPSAWNIDHELNIGYGGEGLLNITDGGNATSDGGTLGWDPGARGTLTVDGVSSAWNNDATLVVGREGDGVVNITNGGSVVNQGTTIGYGTGSTGSVTVDGDGSTWRNLGYLWVGRDGAGTLEITHRGFVRVWNTLTIDADLDGDSSVNIASGGRLAIPGRADASLADFLARIEGTDMINYWDSAISDWSHISNGTMGVDYTLAYVSNGNYTVLTVPEPLCAVFLLLGLSAAFRAHRQAAVRRRCGPRRLAR